MTITQWLQIEQPDAPSTQAHILADEHGFAVLYTPLPR